MNSTFKFINCLSKLNDASEPEQGFTETRLGFMKESITNNKSDFLVLNSKITHFLSACMTDANLMKFHF